MVDRELVVRISADVAGYQRAMSEVGRSTQHLGEQTRAASRDTESFGRSSRSASSSLVGRSVGYAAVGTAIFGIAGAFKSTLQAGVDYQSSLNTLQAVTGSTGQQMVAVAAKARELGNDISLPGASAQTAAAAMTELAKGGLSVQDSMAAAKGTLQLATAAQVDGARAAEIQANALNTFGLAGSSAGHVADVLANTANAASGEIGDFAQGLKQAGLVAHGMGISIDDTATVLGLFAQKGLMGADAGTTLKNMLIYLQHPTKRGSAALKELGVTAFDATGKFVGMRTITGELATAHGKLTQQQYAAATSTAFGTRSVRAAIAMAQSGVPAFDAMGTAVSKQGGAAVLAAAQTKGLRGAFNLVQNAVQDAQLSLMDKLGPALDTTTRRFADLVPSITAQLVPGLASAGTAVIGLAQDGLPLLGSAAGATGSLIGGFGDILHTLGPLLQGIFGGISDVMGVFSKLPGPIQVGITALGAMFLLRGKMNSFGTSIAGAFGSPVRSSISSFGMQMRTSMELAGTSGVRLQAFPAALRGISTAAGAASKGLMGAFGGPVGLAIVGITTVLSIFSAKSAEAKQRVEDQKAAIDSLAQTYDHATGAITDATKAQITDSLGKQQSDFDQLKLSAGAAAQAIIAGTTDGGKSYDAMALKIANAAQGQGLFNDVLHNLSTSGVTGLREIASATGMSETAILHAVTAGGPELAKLQKGMDAAGVSSIGSATAINEVRRNVENFVPSIRDLRQQWDIAGGSAKTAADQTRAWSDRIAAAAKVDPSKLASGIQAAAVGATSLETAFSLRGIKDIPTVIKAMSESALKASDGLHFLTQAQVDAENKAHPLATAAGDVAGALDAAGAASGAAAGITQNAAGQFQNAAGDITNAAGKVDDWATAFKNAKAPADNFATALSDTKAAAADVTTAVDLMSAALQRSTGKDLTAEEAQRATQAAMRGVTQGIYDKARAAQDDVKATRDLATAQADLQKLLDSGPKQSTVGAATLAAAEQHLQTLRDVGLKKHETQATRDAAIATAEAKVAAAQLAMGDKQAQAQTKQDAAIATAKDKVAAAIRTEQDAHLKNAAAQTADVQGYEAAAKSAFDLTSNTTLAALATGNMATATAAGAAEMTKQRAAFIAAAEGAGKSAVEAGKLADSYGLIPKNVKTDFEALTATAQQHGADLYRTYDKTTGKWSAEFRTMGEAAAEIAGGHVLQAYNSTTGTYTGTLTANNVKALTAFQQVKNQPASQLDKTSVIDADKRKMDLAIQIARAEGIPVKTLLMEGNNTDALNKISAAQTAVDNLKGKTVDITYSSIVQTGVGGGHSSALKAAATGGLITGPGTGTSDSILARLSHKEFVVNAKATAKHLPLLEHINSATPAFADGGYVGRTNYNITAPGPAPDFATMMNNAAQGMVAAARKQLTPPTPTLSASQIPGGSGVDRWVPLMNHVIAARGMDVAHIEPIMYAQMRQESSGDPNAINRTDINAQMGHPSVGLLQFIPETFARFADPGYNTNILDPESQMRAFLNYVPANYGSFDYLTSIHNGPYATGGLVNGTGTSTSDSILARVSNGEFVTNAQATAQHRGLLEAINSGTPGFASGGLVSGLPSGRELAGVSAYQPGPREGNVLTALGQIGALLSTWRQAAVDASHAASASAAVWRQAQSDQHQIQKDESSKLLAAQQTAATNRDAAQGNINSVRASGQAAALTVQQNAAAALDAARAKITAAEAAGRSKGTAFQQSAAAALEAAQNKISAAQSAGQSARTASQRASAARRLVAAQQGYDATVEKESAHATAQQAAAIARVAAAQRGYNATALREEALIAKQRASSAGQLLVAQRNYNKVAVAGSLAIHLVRMEQVKANQAAAVAVIQTRAQTVADQRAAVIAHTKLDAEVKAAAATARAQTLLVRLSQQYDTTSTALDGARAQLDGLRTTSAQFAGSIQATISGYDSGILGHPDTRRTGTDVLAGLRFDVSKVSGFSSNLSRDKALGLSPALLAQIAGAGVDGGGATAAVLARSSQSVISQINAQAKLIDHYSGVAGNTVASATYGKSIDAQAKAVNVLAAKVARLSTDLSQIGTKVGQEFGSALNAHIRTLTAQQLAVLVKTGTKELARR